MNNTTQKQIGDTLYIIESVVSENAKETVCNKLKRLILNETNNLQNKRAS